MAPLMAGGYFRGDLPGVGLKGRSAPTWRVLREGAARVKGVPPASPLPLPGGGGGGYLKGGPAASQEALHGRGGGGGLG